MTTLIRSELLQLRTLRSTYAVGAALVALVVAITWGGLAEAKGLLTPVEMQAPVLGAGFIAALIGALLAAARVAGEYRYGTIANRALAAPRRTRLLGAKLLTFGGIGVGAALAAVGVGLATAVPVLAARHMPLVLSAGDAVELTLRVVVAATLFTMLGAIVGFISRSQQAAVVAVFGTFFAEKLLGGMLGEVSNYLPFGLLNALLDGESTSAVPAGVVLAAITAALGVLAAVLLRRRDLN